uniref:Copper transport protein n=1 Tax=Schmidtea mediterranea TaxID=79327 RepID=A0A0H3YJB4_SCHMD|nr:slc31a-1 [Schmidtea mediterranea]
MDMHMPMNHTNGSSMMMMKMYFNEDLNFYLLFGAWQITSQSKLAAACIGSFICALLYELFKRLREYHVNYEINLVANSSESLLRKSVTRKVPVFSRANFLQSLMHLIQTTVSYFLMLIIMSFNTYVFISVIAGLTVGYFFGNAICALDHRDSNEHCQ